MTSRTLKHVKIYTKTGDKGETSLFTGERVPKNDPFIEAIGCVDECNSAIGAAISLIPHGETLQACKEQLTLVQHTLFDLGAALATPRTRASASKLDRTRFEAKGTELLEQWIDAMEEQLTPLHAFILPGGHPAGAMLHLARCICRRAERVVVSLQSKVDVTEQALIYLNRLSDYLFVTSRYLNHLAHSPETFWEKHKV